MEKGAFPEGYRMHEEERLLAVQIRRPAFGPLDVALTAAALPVRLTPVRRLESVGLCLGHEEILLDRDLDEEDQRAVFAHEVGHILIRRGTLLRQLRTDEEALADQFGDELTVPSEALARMLPITARRAARRFGVPPVRAAAQLARLGAIPPLSRLASGEVICQRCGDRESLECNCLYYKVNRDEATSLPLAV